MIKAGEAGHTSAISALLSNGANLNMQDNVSSAYASVGPGAVRLATLTRSFPSACLLGGEPLIYLKCSDSTAIICAC